MPGSIGEDVAREDLEPRRSKNAGEQGKQARRIEGEDRAGCGFSGASLEPDLVWTVGGEAGEGVHVEANVVMGKEIKIAVGQTAQVFPRRLPVCVGTEPKESFQTGLHRSRAS